MDFLFFMLTEVRSLSLGFFFFKSHLHHLFIVLQLFCVLFIRWATPVNEELVETASDGQGRARKWCGVQTQSSAH